MATHDYVIDNQSAPAFRADLNNVLSAIVSQNSSGVEPATTYANMIWYDTTNNQIKKRNEANSAWITLGTVDESAGVFIPTGLPEIATQIEAEAGTDNTKAMTPLRVAEAIAELGVTPTTDNVLAATAGAALGAVGTYAFLRKTGTGDVTAGSTYAGADLRYAGFSGEFGFGETLKSPVFGATPSGTWRAMGSAKYISGAAIHYPATLFLRIA